MIRKIKLLKIRNSIIMVNTLLLLMFFVDTCFCASTGKDQITISQNIEFIDYINKKEKRNRYHLNNETNYPLKYIPSPISSSIHKQQLVKKDHLVMLNLPPRYDLREENGNAVTSIKDQGSCGTCWAFGTYASLESYLKKTYRIPDVNNDYSELHLAYKHGFDPGPCDGGNFYMSAAYLARNHGPIYERQLPYTDKQANLTDKKTSSVRYVDNTIFLPVRENVNDNTYVKEILLTKGALFTSIYWNDDFYNENHYTYYCNQDEHPNHAVTIVGWDDNIEIEGTNEKGAFIVKNSWGEDFGDKGYFYASYHDQSIAFYDLGYYADTDDKLFQFNKVYQYDPLGHVTSIGFGEYIAWAGNIFTAKSNESIVGVGFYATSEKLSYDIYIYDKFVNKEFSNILAHEKGKLKYQGYYTIKLNEKIILQKGKQFAVVIKFDTSESDFTEPIPIESKRIGYSSNASANTGESFVSSDGSSFIDATEIEPDMNVCIKAYIYSDSLTPTTDNYVISGLGKYPCSGGRIYAQQYNSDKTFWTEVNWREYNFHNGESRVVTGDIDGDGKDEIIVGLAKVSKRRMIPGGWFEIIDDNLKHLAWGRIQWHLYNIQNGESWPACGDIDGDGKDEIIIGLGDSPFNYGWFEVFDYDRGYVFHKKWIKSPFSSNNNTIKGKIPLASGDIDGDNLDEIIVGIGSNPSQGCSFAILDDQLNNYQLIAKHQMIFGLYNAANGETRPACGDLNGDGKEEIIIGLGPYSSFGGRFAIYTFNKTQGISRLSWQRVNIPEYNVSNGETRPACGDIDGDGLDEIIIGLGSGGKGIMEIYKYISSSIQKIGNIKIEWEKYNRENGSVWPAILSGGKEIFLSKLDNSVATYSTLSENDTYSSAGPNDKDITYIEEYFNGPKINK